MKKLFYQIDKLGIVTFISAENIEEASIKTGFSVLELHAISPAVVVEPVVPAVVVAPVVPAVVVAPVVPAVVVAPVVPTVVVAPVVPTVVVEPAAIVPAPSV